MKSLNVACTLLEDIPSAKEDKITDEFDKLISEKLNTLSENSFVIEEAIVKQAIELVQYFNFHKIVINGYKVDVKKSFSTEVRRIIDEANSTKKVLIQANQMANNGPLMLKIMKAILAAPVKEIASGQAA